jgi:hypothetical protein
VKHYFEHRCSNCGWVAGRTTRKRAAIGRSFEECSSCGTFVPRTPFDEWALMGTRTRLGVLCADGAIVLALGLTPAALAGVGALLSERAAQPRTLLILAGAGLVLSLGAWMGRMSHTLNRSRRRMSDPWYRAKLAQFAIQEERLRSSFARGASGEVAGSARTQSDP